MMRVMLRVVATAVLLSGLSAQAEEVQVAVAANFAAPFQRIAALFQAETGYQAKVSVGSTGQFAAQIREGAPFEVLLAADQDTPRRLEQAGLTVIGQRFTYAKGRLVLWSTRKGWIDDQGAVLRQGAFTHLALANPQLAPYGAAGIEVLKAMGLDAVLSPKIVQGNNIAQTFQFVASCAAELGFVALSQVRAPDKPAAGSYWIVPASLYAPILQDAVLLRKGERHAAARALMAFLHSERARAVIGAFGYGL